MLRRHALKLLAASPLIAMSQRNPAAQPAPATMIRRPVPRSGELLPVIGLGTYIVFDVASNAPEMAELGEVLKTFVAGGASVVDSSPMYGRAESAVGELAGELALHPSLFLATKVWTTGREAGIRQMQNSLRVMRTQRIDLMQVHNLLDLATHLKTRVWWPKTMSAKRSSTGSTH